MYEIHTLDANGITTSFFVNLRTSDRTLAGQMFRAHEEVYPTLKLRLVFNYPNR